MNINKGSLCNSCELLHVLGANFNIPMCMGGMVSRTITISEGKVASCSQYTNFKSHNRKAGSSSGLRKDNPRRK